MAHPLHLTTLQVKITRLLLLPFVAACLLGSGANRATAQASYAAARADTPLAVFGAFSRLNPDYGPQTNYGYTFGVDYTRHYRFLDPSLEGRVNHAGGQTVGQTSYMGGIKGGKDFGRFHPYGDFLLGYGKITFTHPHGQYFRDDSTVFDAGGGVDVDIIGNLAAKADFQFQSWKLGSANSRLTPKILSFGLVYRLPVKF